MVARGLQGQLIMDTKAAVEKIVDSIKECQKDKGFVLVSEDWGSDTKKCACAIGCLLKVNKKSLEVGPTIEAAELLKVGETWVEAFTSGFDETPWTPDWVTADVNEQKSLVEAYQAGIEMKNQFKPMKYHVYHDAFVSGQE